MNTFLQFFKASAIFTIASMVFGYFYGMSMTGTWEGGISTAFLLMVLGIMETSLSFDNAIVNAKVLENMNDVWRHRFLTWGMLIAVFGMRIIFPILIVSIFAHIDPISALIMAISNPAKYAETLTAAHIMIAGFGGSFLLMVALKYFFDSSKDVHWIEPIEKIFPKIGKHCEGPAILTIAIIIAVSICIVPRHEGIGFLTSSFVGVFIYELVHYIASKLEEKEERDIAAGIVKGGVMTFLYLEILDASFSFDGVIGAFVLTNNIFLIAAGLGIGAMFVRSLTLMFVAKKTLSEFKYLEHGAFWSILVLACIMFLSISIDIPEWVTGALSVMFIGTAFIHSIIVNKNKPSTI